MTQLTSRERMRRAINFQDIDHIPCCFMLFSVLQERSKDNLEFGQAQMALGLDPMLLLPSPIPPPAEHPSLWSLPMRLPASVRVVERRENVGSDFDILHKAYITPAGTLTTSVRLSEDWPFGDHIPVVDDHMIPRMVKPLVAGPEDLPALQHLLQPPDEQDVAQFNQEAKDTGDFASQQGVFLAGGWGVGMDMLQWLCGMQNLMTLTSEKPDFVTDLLEMVITWNRTRMKVLCSAPIDLYIQRAWYEGCDFINRSFFRKSVLPRLKEDVELVHGYGKKFGYIISSGIGPMLDFYLEAGIDTIIGIDPVQGTYTDMEVVKRKIGEHICIWGGVNGAMTVELGTEEDVRSAVRNAIQTLGPAGFILSPVDDLKEDWPRTWSNINVLVDEWRRHW
jgi:uroporphyrinogen-III decarboxylase